MKIAIVGAGKLGQKITESLLGGDNEVTLIDKNDALLQKMSAQFDLLPITANAKEIDFLRSIKIETYDYLVACADTDEKNILICTFAKKLGCPAAIARVRDPEHVTQLKFIQEIMDIDYIVNPDWSMAVEIFKYLVEKHTLSDGLFSSGKAGILEFQARKLPLIIDKKLLEISEILENMLIVCISKNGKILAYKDDLIVDEGDDLYVVGNHEELQKLDKIVHDNRRNAKLDKAMIIGGGKSGLYLARLLADHHVFVKIIELERDRCKYLSEHLPSNVLVLNGDATDMNFLEDENLKGMGAFFAATGFDEDNLLLALNAKQYGLENVIAKVSRKNYSELIGKLGIDMALNPLDITANSILRFIQGNKRVIFTQIIQGQAEIFEIIAQAHMAIIDRKISEIDLPEGVVIGSICRKDEIIIPNKDSQIHSGDRIIIFSLLSAAPELEKLLRSGRGGLFK